jgi:hypothetical protein
MIRLLRALLARIPADPHPGYSRLDRLDGLTPGTRAQMLDRGDPARLVDHADAVVHAVNAR